MLHPCRASFWPHPTAPPPYIQTKHTRLHRLLPAGGSPAGELSEEDSALLGRYVSPSYLQEGNWGRVQAKFAEDGSVQLHNFLRPEWARQVASAVAAADEADRLGRGQVPAYDAGMHSGWQAVGPCHKQRFLRYSPGSSDGSSDGDGGRSAAALGALMAQIQRELFASAAFAKLLSKVSGACWCCKHAGGCHVPWCLGALVNPPLAALSASHLHAFLCCASPGP
jgi:hypothetical protein